MIRQAMPDHLDMIRHCLSRHRRTIHLILIRRRSRCHHRRHRLRRCFRQRRRWNHRSCRLSRQNQSCYHCRPILLYLLSSQVLLYSMYVSQAINF
jgi:hypothetical protein